MTRVLPIVFCLLAGSLASAQEAEQSEEELRAEYQAYVAQIEGRLDFVSGRARIVGGSASIDLGDDYRYLRQDDARKVLEELWGNPPDESTLGLVVPADGGLTGASSWAVVISYQNDGHIDDEDASGIDYDELLGEMQQSARDNNGARMDAGYGSVVLVGWAEQPRYDQAAKKMFWAKELQFNADPDHTLNYDVRVLGREGVLVMSAVATMDSLPLVRPAMQDLLARTEFDAGARYADFDPSTDNLATYGVAALVAGGIASKTGLLAKLGILLLSLKKFLVLIVIGVGYGISKLFGRKKTKETLGKGD